MLDRGAVGVGEAVAILRPRHEIKVGGPGRRVIVPESMQTLVAFRCQSVSLTYCGFVEITPAPAVAPSWLAVLFQMFE